MTNADFILSRMQELDDWRWDGKIAETEYQELSSYWRRCLRAEEQAERFPHIVQHP